MATHGLVPDEDNEESGEAERIVVADGFEMAPERFGTDINAEDRL
jgi:hypothetical protein